MDAQILDETSMAISVMNVQARDAFENALMKRRFGDGISEEDPAMSWCSCPLAAPEVPE